MSSVFSRRGFITRSSIGVLGGGLTATAGFAGGSAPMASIVDKLAFEVPVKVKDLVVTIHKREPNPDPIQDAIQTLPGVGNVVVKITSEDGITGEGSIYFGRIDGALAALKSFIDNVLKPLVINTELGFIRKTFEAMVRETDYHGTMGFATMGIAAIDTALWDCLGKTLQVPCWKLWGGCHTELPVYAMVGWINLDDASIRKRCEESLALGYKAVKVKIGFPTLSEDIKRIKFVREVIGEDNKLMIDANQAFTVGEAIRRGHAFEELDCYWYEEPIPAQDIEGYKRLSRELKIQVATGENLFSPRDFASFIKNDAVDIIQPDLRRSGGPTALLDIGKTANAFGIPYASHGSDAAHFNVMACLPNALIVETGGNYRLKDGKKEIPEGWGFSWE